MALENSKENETETKEPRQYRTRRCQSPENDYGRNTK